MDNECAFCGDVYDEDLDEEIDGEPACEDCARYHRMKDDDGDD